MNTIFLFLILYLAKMSILISACPHLYMYHFLFFCLLSLFNTSASHCFLCSSVCLYYSLYFILPKHNIAGYVNSEWRRKFGTVFFCPSLQPFTIFWHLHFGAGYFQEENIFLGNKNEEYLFTVLTLLTINIVTRAINLQWFMNMLRQVGLNSVLLNWDNDLKNHFTMVFFMDSSFVHIFRKLQHDHHTKTVKKK